MLAASANRGGAGVILLGAVPTKKVVAAQSYIRYVVPGHGAIYIRRDVAARASLQVRRRMPKASPSIVATAIYTLVRKIPGAVLLRPPVMPPRRVIARRTPVRPTRPVTTAPPAPAPYAPAAVAPPAPAPAPYAPAPSAPSPGGGGGGGGGGGQQEEEPEGEEAPAEEASEEAPAEEAPAEEAPEGEEAPPEEGGETSGFGAAALSTGSKYAVVGLLTALLAAAGYGAYRAFYVD